MLMMTMFSLSLSAQITRVRGTISDKKTTEPLAFVNLMFKGTTIGTHSDINGNFDLSVHKSIDTLLVSYLGFKPQKIKIQPNKVNDLKIQLESAETMLNVVEIKPGENPAHRIMREVVRNKVKNNPAFVDAYQYRVYNKIQFDMNNYGDKLAKRKVLKPVDFVFNYADTTEEGKVFLPIAISENTSDVYYTRNPQRKQELILGTQISGLKNASVSQFLGDMYQTINIYDNFLLIFNRSFVSPVTDNFLRYYKYYLIDSVYIDQHRCYKLLFLPKRKQDLTFTGDLYIDDQTWGVRKVNIRFNEQANVNYIKSFHVTQEYQHVDNKTWMLKKEESMGDFAPFEKGDGVGFFGRKTTVYDRFKLNPDLPDSLFRAGDNITITKGAEELNNAAWDSLRLDTLSRKEQGIYAMVDSVVDMPLLVNTRYFVQMLATGYLRWDEFQLGQYYTFCSWNSIEGVRFKFGGITDNSFSNRLELRGWLAYGLNDERFKVKAGFRWFVNSDKTHRNLWAVSYKSDLEQLSLSPNSLQLDNIMTSMFRRTALQYVTNVEELKTTYEYEHFPGFMHRFTALNRRLTPLGDFAFVRGANDAIVPIQNTTTTEFSLHTRFAWKEKYISGEFDRISAGSKAPVLQLDLTAGVPNIMGSEFSYYKVRFRIGDRIRLNPFGYTDYQLDLSQTWGNAPFPFLDVHQGSQTYALDQLAFNMMNIFEFASDRYASLFIDHHFEGYFLNKIPLLRKLKWREVLTLKSVIGDIRESNLALMNYPGGLDPRIHRPYLESGVAVENILKVIRIDALWRMTHLERPLAKPFGLRMSLVFRF
jgi:hypothetical protein